MTGDTEGSSQLFLSSAVSAREIQGGIVRSYRPLFTHYLFLQIENVHKFRTWLGNRLGLTSPSPVGAVSSSEAISGLQGHQALRNFLTSSEAPLSARILTEGDRILSRRARSLGGPSTVQAGADDRASSTIVPLTIAFTWTGLERLEIDPVTLETFPEVFRQGMAARSELLSDVGRSAPENWQGWLGNRKIHVLLGMILTQSGTNRQQGAHQANPSNLFRSARDLCDAFERGEEAAHEELRKFADITGLLARHIECGFRPRREFNGVPRPVEHFGFRDGLSQPFLVLADQDQLQPTPPGGGHPRRDGTWDPMMPGEIFLGYPDEDNLRAIEPANPDLRNNGTYMVFRKLAQDVIAFHDVLKKSRETKVDQDRLAAQMMGRWPNGAPLVRHPNSSQNYGPGSVPGINDFRYHFEDPHGRRCPLEAHARRVNPRDTQLRDLARRHRILRQSIPYGGEWVDDPDKWDGKERGLLFVCYNARIDSQFELIQSHWINRGEMFGQAGLGRCPITGVNSGRAESIFHVPDNPAAIPLPELVTNRGGDYFFVPGRTALGKIASGEKFIADPAAPGFPKPMESCPGTDIPTVRFDVLRQVLKELVVPLMTSYPPLNERVATAKPQGKSVHTDARATYDVQVTLPQREELIKFLKAIDIDPRILVDQPYLAINPALAETPQLFNEDRIKLLAVLTLAGIPRPVIRFKLPLREYTGGRQRERHIAFVGKHADVVSVLSDRTHFGVAHHKKTFDALTRGHNMLMGLDDDGIERAERRERHNILRDGLTELAQQALDPGGHPSQWFRAELVKFLPRAVQHAMARVVPSGKLDVVSDLAVAIPVMVAQHLFGLPGPERISPTAVAAMFARLEFTDVPADWLKRLPASMDHEKPAITIAAWGQAIFREIFVNIVRAHELTDHGRRMTDELFAHIDELMEKDFRHPRRSDGPSANLLSVLMKQRRTMVNDISKPVESADRFAARVKLLLAELLVGGIYTVAKALTNVVDFMIDPRFVRKIHFEGQVYDRENHDLSDILFKVLRAIAAMKAGPDRDRKLDGFISESLRFAFRSLLFRVCKKTTSVNGVEIKKGDLVATIIAAANLDWNVFAEPGTPPITVFDFRIDRPQENYLHFGAHERESADSARQPSLHYCLGAELAKAEMREMLLAIANLRQVRRAAGPRGALEEVLLLPQSLVIRFDPVASTTLQ